MQQQHFKDLPEASMEMQQPDIFLPPSSPPVLTSLSTRQAFLKQELFCSTTELDIQSATLKCEVLCLEKALLSRSAQLDQEKSTVTTLEEKFRIDSQNRHSSEEESRVLFKQQLETLTACQHDLSACEDKYGEMCQQDKDTREMYDKLSAKGELLAAEFSRKRDEFASTLRGKEMENGAIERKLSEALSEKAIVEESFRLFKSSILTDLDKEGEDSADNNLMIKIRLLQESNAQLSAEVKSMSRRCIDSDVDVAAVREELSLSDRMKTRLSSSVDNQSIAIDMLEKKLLLANQLLLQEQAARDEVKEASRSVELQLIQSKFTNERLEISILDLKETKQSLDKSLSDQIQENQRWVDRLKNVENSTHVDQEKVQREYALSFERDMQLEKQKLARQEGECSNTRTSLQTVSSSLNTANEENKQLQMDISALGAQLERFSEIESCVADMQTDLENKEDEIATLCQAFEKRGDSMKELERRISLQASEISFLRPERDSKAKIAKAFEGQVGVLQNEKAELLRVSSQNDNRGSVIDELKMTIMQYQQKLKDITDDKGRLNNSNTQLDILKTNYRILKDDYDDVEATMVELSKAAADEIEQREQQILTLRSQVAEREETGLQMQNEIRSLKKSKAKYLKQVEEAASSSMFGFGNSNSNNNDK
jgi:hypothetical protein